MEQKSAESWVEWLDGQLGLMMVGKKAAWMVALMVVSTVAEKVGRLAVHLVGWKV